jgi:hypothetical protein
LSYANYFGVFVTLEGFDPQPSKKNGASTVKPTTIESIEFVEATKPQDFSASNWGIDHP